MMAHSLVREHSQLLNELSSGTVKMNIQVNKKTGEANHSMHQELPPEEAFESFAARVRPFLMNREPVYWATTLDALEKLLSKETLAELVDIEDLRNHWKNVVEGSTVAQAYYMVTDKGKLTDMQLANLWMYSDALHAQVINSEVGKSLSLNQRYQAAAGVYARIGACANSTLYLIQQLVKDGLLDLDPSVFTAPATADSHVEFPGKMTIYSAEVGTDLPTDLSDLDPEVWKPIHEDIELVDGEGEPEDDA
jgi:hypothetical protein